MKDTPWQWALVIWLAITASSCTRTMEHKELIKELRELRSAVYDVHTEVKEE